MAEVAKALANPASPLFEVLLTAVGDGNVRVIKTLDANVKLGQLRINGTTWLHVACDRASYVSVQTMLELGGFDVNATDDKGVTPLMICCIKGGTNIAEHLCVAGADVSIVLPDGRTALTMAVQSGCRQAVTLLLNRGADPGWTNPTTGTPISVLLGRANRDAPLCADIMELFIEHEKSTALAATEAMHVYTIAMAKLSRWTILMKMYHRGVALPCHEVLRIAVIQKKQDVVELSVAAGVLDVPTGKTALMLSAQVGDEVIFDLLWRTSTDEHILVEHEGMTAMSIAATQPRIANIIIDSERYSSDAPYVVDMVEVSLNNHTPEVITALINSGVSPDMTVNKGCTALTYAAGLQYGCGGGLLKCGADPNLVDSRGLTPLCAAMAANQSHLRCDLIRVADPNLESKYGPPLFIAFRNKSVHWKSVAELLTAGADPRTVIGKTNQLMGHLKIPLEKRIALVAYGIDATFGNNLYWGVPPEDEEKACPTPKGGYDPPSLLVAIAAGYNDRVLELIEKGLLGQHERIMYNHYMLNRVDRKLTTPNWVNDKALRRIEKMSKPQQTLKSLPRILPTVWSRELHHRFSAGYKMRVFTFCLVMYRLRNTTTYGLPTELVTLILECA